MTRQSLPLHALFAPGIGGEVLGQNGVLRGEGGVPPQKIYFYYLDIYCSPGYPNSKMGSFASQLATVAEIWPVKVGSYAQIFGVLYREILNFRVSK